MSEDLKHIAAASIIITREELEKMLSGGNSEDTLEDFEKISETEDTPEEDIPEDTPKDTPKETPAEDPPEDTPLEPLVVPIRNDFSLKEIFSTGLAVGMFVYILTEHSNSFLGPHATLMGFTAAIGSLLGNFWVCTEGFKKTPAALEARRNLALVKSAERFFREYDRRVAKTAKGSPGDPGFLVFSADGSYFEIST